MSIKKENRSAVQRIRSVPPMPHRARNTNKGDYGRVLVIGGSLGMAGAPSLVGLAALRSGAGLVTIAVPSVIQPTVAGLCPCATTMGLPETRDGRIDPLAARDVLAARGLLPGEVRGTPPDVLVVGPGIGLGGEEYGQALWELINAFRDGGRAASVIDADALNLMHRARAGGPAGWDGQRHFRTVITPHPGELGRMHGVSAGEVQGSREAFALRTAQLMRAAAGAADEMPVVVLKGAGTLVTDGSRLYVNRNGNPGMATGGSGDVLAGIIGALVGQGLDLYEAAVTGVHLHGLAGDLAARRKGQVSLIATDLIDFLPEAFFCHARK